MYAQVDKNTPSVYAFVPSTKRPRELELALDQVRWRSNVLRRRTSIHYLESFQEAFSMADVVQT